MERRKNIEKIKKIVTLPLSYNGAPGSTLLSLSLVIHKGVEVIILQVGPSISVASLRLG